MLLNEGALTKCEMDWLMFLVIRVDGDEVEIR